MRADWVEVESLYRDYDEQGNPLGTPTWVKYRAGDWEITVKWDGCADLVRYYNNDPDDYTYVHICDLAELRDAITQIEELTRWRK